VAHETGHQWFYNAVGNDQINQPWIDESLTQYVTGLYFLDVYGDPGWEYSTGDWQNRWDRVGAADIPIGMPAAYYSSLEYGAIVYSRGPLFFVELAETLGLSFDSYLRQYYQDHKWEIVTTAGFQDWFENISGQNLDELFDEWVLP
jgi:aminopeptidase N